jgi:hypothetical protein
LRQVNLSVQAKGKKSDEKAGKLTTAVMFPEGCCYVKRFLQRILI